METETLTNGATGQIYGTFAEAVSYLGGMFGDQYTAWTGLDTDDERKQTLIAATRRLNRLSWSDTAPTFAARDAIVSDDSVKLFQVACYELAALAADDPSVLTTADQGTNIEQVDAAGVGVRYFNPQSRRQGNATILPPIVMDLIGDYLATDSTNGPDGGDGESGSCESPFDFEHNLAKRWQPF